VPATRGCFVRELNSGNFKAAFRSVKQKAVCTADLNQSTRSAVATDEFDVACKLTAQDRLAPDVVGITIGVLARKIAACIVNGRIRPDCVGSADTAFSSEKCRESFFA
jgi:hypothetical protein